MKILKKILLLFLVLLVAGGGIVTYMGYAQYRDAIEEQAVSEAVQKIQEDPHYVAYEEISPWLLKATVAIEDHRFYSHGGFDVIATGRALVNNLLHTEILGGGSTITQQLAKNMYFGYEPSFIRKLSELFVVHDLEDAYTKVEILTLYVNIINYGDNHMGIREASLGYFQVEPSELTLGQASLLAGLPQSPANYQLSNHYEEAKERQKQVLDAMLSEQIITEQERTDALAQTY